MTYLRKNLIVLSVVFMMLLTVFGGSLNINALENNRLLQEQLSHIQKNMWLVAEKLDIQELS